ncbi:MAG: hypothetical protein ACPGF8_05450, partial [Opitutales bacterium]
VAKYRKIDSRIWNDEKFRELSDNGKLVFLFLLTHPHMTALGAMRATIPGLASEIGWSQKAFAEAFREAFAKGMAKHDEKACFLWLPNFLKYNKPESPNVVKAWESSLDLLPECALKSLLIQCVKDFTEGLTEGFQKALPEAFAKAMPYQEQEQEQEQEQDKDYSAISSLPESDLLGEEFRPDTTAEKSKRNKPKKHIPDDFTVTPLMLSWVQENNFAYLDICNETDRFIDHFKSKGEARADWIASWRTWIRNADKFKREAQKNGGQRDRVSAAIHGHG